MANNALIQGAALTSKKFVDIGGAVGKALSSLSVPTGSKSRADENKAIQARVNNYMSKMKTDMDFTSFSPEETATMRNFLLQQRSVYAEAAKMAAKFDDTTDPEYMNYVDQMQGVNNSFTNLASQLKSYKQGKLDYAQNQLDGLYSNGNDPGVNNNAAIIFGFADEDKDKRADKGIDAPFQILQGGNLGFNIDGNEISYNDMPMPGLKDNKLANSILTKNEAIYNQGLQGGELNPEMLKAYELNLEDQLQNRDALRSIVFDYESELNIFSKEEEIANSVALENGTLSYDDLRKSVVSRLVNARKGVFNSGKSIYNKKKLEQEGEGEGVGYFAIPKIAEALGIMQNKILNDTYFSDGVVDIINLKRQGKLGDSVTQTYYFTKNNDGKILISTSKEDVGNGQAKPRDTFDPANEADVKRAKEEFGIDIVPTF